MLPDGTKPLPHAVLACHQLEYISMKFQMKYYAVSFKKMHLKV